MKNVALWSLNSVFFVCTVNIKSLFYNIYCVCVCSWRWPLTSTAASGWKLQLSWTTRTQNTTTTSYCETLTHNIYDDDDDDDHHDELNVNCACVRVFQVCQRWPHPEKVVGFSVQQVSDGIRAEVPPLLFLFVFTQKQLENCLWYKPELHNWSRIRVPEVSYMRLNTHSVSLIFHLFSGFKPGASYWSSVLIH